MTPHDEPFDVGLSDADARLIDMNESKGVVEGLRTAVPKRLGLYRTRVP